MRITVRLPDDLGEDVKRRTDNVSGHVTEALTEKSSAKSSAVRAGSFWKWRVRGLSTPTSTRRISGCVVRETGVASVTSSYLLDTNLLVYCFDDRGPEKQKRALEILDRVGRGPSAALPAQVVGGSKCHAL
jgi:hypothetical protein